MKLDPTTTNHAERMLRMQIVLDGLRELLARQFPDLRQDIGQQEWTTRTISRQPEAATGHLVRSQNEGGER